MGEIEDNSRLPVEQYAPVTPGRVPMLEITGLEEVYYVHCSSRHISITVIFSSYLKRKLKSLQAEAGGSPVRDAI